MMKKDEPLRAVVIADNFDSKFSPLTKYLPNVLLPLVETPLLSYTLDYLARNGVQEVYLCCCSHHQKIQNFINTSRWKKPNAPFKLKLVISENYMSMGDMIRDIDSRDLFRSDFILITGSIVANLPLKPIILEHMKRRKTDKNALMTLIFRHAASNHRGRCKEENTLIATDSVTNKLLYYSKSFALSKFFKFPYELITENKDMIIQNDIIDTHISICSPEVITQFTDNFDFQTRDDFIKGILLNEEIMGKTIFVHKTSKHYIVPVTNFVMYDAVSKDIMQKYAYPYLLDSLPHVDETKFKSFNNNLYMEKDITLLKNFIFNKIVAIGENSQIGENVRISNSIIGKRCKVGNNVEINECFLWDDVVIGDNCKLEKSIFANNCELKSDVKIGPGCIISFNVVIGKGIVISPFTRIQELADNEIQDKSPIEKNVSLVGKEGLGYLYEAEEGEENVIDVWGAISDLDDKESDLEKDENESLQDEESSSDSELEPEDVTALYYNEILDSLTRGVEMEIQAENIIHDLNSLKFEHNITVDDLISQVTRAILNIPLHQQKTPRDYYSFVEKLIKKYTPVYKKYSRNQSCGTTVLLSLERFALENQPYASLLTKLIHVFYETDIVSEDEIFDWHENPIEIQNFSQDQQAIIRKNVSTLIVWLKEAEEESD